jgi:hypothetical protein
MKRLWLLLLVLALLGMAAYVAPRGPVRGGLVVAVLFVVVGAVIAWLSRAGPRLSASGEDPHPTGSITVTGHDGTPHG